MSDSYSNLKHQQVIAEFGLEGYGFYWVCLEIVAQQGQNFRIKGDKKWKLSLSYQTRMKNEKIETLLHSFGSAGLIDKKALEIGDLFIPKMSEYADEYTEKMRRISRQKKDNVGLEQIRTDKNTKEDKEMQEVFSFWLSQNVIKPRTLNSDTGKEILKALKNYSLEEIKTAIETYATVLERGVDETKRAYWWSHSWTLFEFLKRGMKQFEGKVPKDYLKSATNFNKKVEPKVHNFATAN